MNKKGFTLVEVLTVIAIISVVVLIAIPSIIAINKKINERLYANKKETILVAAELYGRDNPNIFPGGEAIVSVSELIENGYIDAEKKASECGEYSNGEIEEIDYNSVGCIINPVDKKSINNEKILLKRQEETIIAIWNGGRGTSVSVVLVDKVKTDLNCGDGDKQNKVDKEDKSECIYKGKDPNNYLYYSGYMWRILGVYKDDSGVEFVKMVTDENIVWEEE